MSALPLRRLEPRWLIAALAMLAAAALALALKPTRLIADQRPQLELETLIPKHFDGWRPDASQPSLIVNPQQEALLARIYRQTLNRSYVGPGGERVMLAIAYGADQSDAMQVHKPEVCYPAQGFQILGQAAGQLRLRHGSIPVRRLVASNGARVEPVTYWLTIGDTVAAGGLQWKLAQLKYGLSGRVPDGLLFRVSSIDADEQSAYAAQERFVVALLAALTASQRERLIGGPRGE